MRDGPFWNQCVISNSVMLRSCGFYRVYGFYWGIWVGNAQTSQPLPMKPIRTHGPHMKTIIDQLSCSFVRFPYKKERTNTQHQHHVGCGYIKVYPQGRDNNRVIARHEDRDSVIARALARGNLILGTGDPHVAIAPRDELC